MSCYFLALLLESGISLKLVIVWLGAGIHSVSVLKLERSVFSSTLFPPFPSALTPSSSPLPPSTGNGGGRDSGPVPVEPASLGPEAGTPIGGGRGGRKAAGRPALSPRGQGCHSTGYDHFNRCS